MLAAFEREQGGGGRKQRGPKPGDTVRAVNGKTVATWNDVRREIVTDEPPESPESGRQHDALAMKQARVVLDRILDELDDDKRAVFVLYEIEELSMAEVADALGCPLQTAYSRLHAARKLVESAVERAKTGRPS